MPGNKIGAAKTRNKNLERDPDFFKKIGHLGGVAPYKGLKGFAAMSPEDRAHYGKIGGALSKRKSKKSIAK